MGLAKKIQLQVKEIRLISDGKELENQYTIEKYDLKDEDILFLARKKLHGCFRANSPILCSFEGNKPCYQPIKNLRQGNSLLSYDVASQKFFVDTITYMEKINVSTFAIINFSN